jgi:hypothetical protein
MLSKYLDKRLILAHSHSGRVYKGAGGLANVIWMIVTGKIEDIFYPA